MVMRAMRRRRCHHRETDGIVLTMSLLRWMARVCVRATSFVR